MHGSVEKSEGKVLTCSNESVKKYKAPVINSELPWYYSRSVTITIILLRMLTIMVQNQADKLGRVQQKTCIFVSHCVLQSICKSYGKPWWGESIGLHGSLPRGVERIAEPRFVFRSQELRGKASMLIFIDGSRKSVIPRETDIFPRVNPCPGMGDEDINQESKRGEKEKMGEEHWEYQRGLGKWSNIIGETDF